MFVTKKVAADVLPAIYQTGLMGTSLGYKARLLAPFIQDRFLEARHKKVAPDVLPCYLSNIPHGNVLTLTEHDREVGQ